MRLEKLEALRGFAAFYVVLHHTISENITLFGYKVGPLLRFGQEAVILFFLLSGFVINYSFRKSTNKTFGTYFSKRFLRIYIPLIVIFFIGYITESYNAGLLVNPDIVNLAKNLLMLQDWDKVKPNVLAAPYMDNIPLWSLSYEWWFYMLFFPIVTFSKNRQLRDILVVGVCIAAAIAYVYHPNFITRLLTYLIIWWAGVQLSDLYLDSKINFKTALPLVLGVLAVMAVLLISVVSHKHNGGKIILGFHPFLEFRHLASAVIMIGAGVVWYRARWWGFNAIFKPFLLLAPISYAMYISHIHIMVNATYLDWIENQYIEWFAYFAVLILFSIIVELGIYPAVKRALTIKQA